MADPDLTLFEGPQAAWGEVDAYLVETLLPRDPALEAALGTSDAAGLPAINVAPNQGRLLELLARAVGARRILEVGTLGGYSTIWMGRALPPDGELVTLELDPAHADVARANLDRAGLGDRAEIRVGPALASLRALVREGAGPFDLTFIDADKQSSAEYFALALQLSRPGAAIVVDNVVRDGAVVDPASPDDRVRGVRRLLDAMAAEPRVAATAVQTVGSKGWDGFALALVLDDSS